MYALDCNVAIYAQGALSQTRVVRARKSENKPKVPVLSHWQRSFVAIPRQSPFLYCGTPRSFGDAVKRVLWQTTAQKRSSRLFLFRSSICNAERLYGFYAIGTAIGRRSARSDFHQGIPRYLRRQAIGLLWVGIQGTDAQERYQRRISAEFAIANYSRFSG